MATEVLVTADTIKIKSYPVEYKTVTTKVVTVPARTETIVIPAVYNTVKKKVMVKTTASYYKQNQKGCFAQPFFMNTQILV